MATSFEYIELQEATNGWFVSWQKSYICPRHEQSATQDLYFSDNGLPLGIDGFGHKARRIYPFSEKENAEKALLALKNFATKPFKAIDEALFKQLIFRFEGSSRTKTDIVPKNSLFENAESEGKWLPSFYYFDKGRWLQKEPFNYWAFIDRDLIFLEAQDSQKGFDTKEEAKRCLFNFLLFWQEVQKI